MSAKSLKSINNPNSVKVGSNVRIKAEYAAGIDRVYRVAAIDGELSNRVQLEGQPAIRYAFELSVSKALLNEKRPFTAEPGILFSSAATA